LAGQVDTLSVVTIAAALRKGARSLGELGGDGSVLGNPVGKSILTVLNNSLASLVTVVCLASLSGGDRGVIDELEEVLAVAGDDG